MVTVAASPDSDESRRGQQRTPLFLLAIAALLLGGCLSQAPRPEQPGLAGQAPEAGQISRQSFVAAAKESDRIEAVAAFRPKLEDAMADEPPPIWDRLRRGFSLPQADTPRVQREVRRLQASPRAAMALLLRAEPYLHHILDQIELAGLPHELALLPAVESGFVPHAYSASGAAGLWQFMPATGGMLDLQQDWWHDQRRSVVESTTAAISYLQILHRRFDGDWLHALAAYNAGSATVKRAIAKAHSRHKPTDYWSLDLPRETESYIPRLLALSQLVAAPEAFGLELPEMPDEPFFAVVDTGGQIDLAVAAELAGVPLDELLALNPAQRRWASHPDGPHRLLVPVAASERLAQALLTLPPEERLRWRRHQIREGDNLIRIAREYDVSVDAIKRANGLTDSRIRAGRDLLIPLSDSVDEVARLNGPAQRQQMQYRVRQGDSLYRIAQRFRVRVADLKRWNSLGRYLQPGDRLTLYVDPDA